MDIAKIENGVVVQVQRGCAKAEAFPDDPAWVELPPGVVACGMLWDGLSLTSPPAQVATPVKVTPRQIRLALSQLGLRSAVEDYVAAADQAVKDSWEYTTEFDRNHPLIAAAAQALNKTDAEIDALFSLAATL